MLFSICPSDVSFLLEKIYLDFKQSLKKKSIVRSTLLPQWASSRSLLRTWLQSLVRELRSHNPNSAAKKKKPEKKIE